EGQLVLRTGKQKNDGKAAVCIALERIYCGMDGDGEDVYSLVVSGESGAPLEADNDNQPRSNALSPVGEKVLAVLRAAGPQGLELTEWRNRAREAGVGPGRPATANEWTLKLIERRLVVVLPDGRYVEA